jgi:putative colanic acid biosynthesis acetyltransferase WcaF
MNPTLATRASSTLPRLRFNPQRPSTRCGSFTIDARPKHNVTSNAMTSSASIQAQPEIRPYVNRLGLGNQAARWLWGLVWLFLFRPSPILFHAWRRQLLRCFGATIGRGARAYPRCHIWAPWNLTMEDHSGLANDVDCYSVAPIVIGSYANVSQYVQLCAGTHDYTDPDFRLISKPIKIGAQAWVAAGAFVGPGVTVGEGAVIGARSVVLRDVPEWTVVAGNPCRTICRRLMTPRS